MILNQIIRNDHAEFLEEVSLAVLYHGLARELLLHPLLGPKFGYWRITIDSEERMWFAAISEYAKLIVSGHWNGTTRLWEAHTDEPVGEPMYNHLEGVNSVAIECSLIVSGSNDSFLYRYNAITGEVIGNASQGDEGVLLGVATSADDKPIVSSSFG